MVRVNHITWCLTKRERPIFYFLQNWPWRFSSSCFVLHTSMIYCLKSFSQVQICHLLTSSSFSLPMLCRWTLVQLIMMGDIERRVTLPFPSLYDSLTRFPLSSVPHVSARRLLRILLTRAAPVLCPVAHQLAIKPTDNCRAARSGLKCW